MDRIISIDFLGPEMNFNVKKQKTFRSNYGVVASLLLIGVAVISFLGFGRDIFERKQPRVTFNKITEDSNKQRKNLTDSNFLFSIYDQYTDQPIPEFDRRFEVYYDFLDFRGEGMIDKNFRNPFEKCSNKTLKSYSEFLNMEPSSYYCFPKGSEIELTGVMSQGKSSLVRLQLDFCKNNTEIKKGKIRTDCYTRQETQTFLSSNRIQMNYIIESAIIDSTNYLEPGTRYVYSNSMNTNAFSWARLSILFKKIVVETDVGFFVQDKQLWESMAFESIMPESIYSPETNTVFSFLIGNSPWKEIYTRYYVKIQDVFAMMGGFLNASIIILKFIVEYFSRPKLVDLFNNIYKYEQNVACEEIKSQTNKYSVSNTKILKNYFVQPSSMLDLNSSKLKISQPGYRINYENKKSDLISNDDKTSLIRLLKNKNKNLFNSNMNNFKNVLRCFVSPKKDIQIKFYKIIDEKFKKILSLEHFIKITKNLKIFKEVLLKRYQYEVVKICQVPKRKESYQQMNIEIISEYLLKGINQEKLINTENITGIDTKLFEMILR